MDQGQGRLRSGLLLDKAAVDNGYADAQAARDALVEKPSNTWTTTERAFLSSFTNVEFVESEGSFGLHNWDYSREIVNTAMMQAKIAQSGVIVKTAVEGDPQDVQDTR